MTKQMLYSRARAFIILGALALLGTVPALAQVSSGKVTTTAPTYVNGTANAFSLDTSGNLRVVSSGSGGTGAVNITQVAGTPVGNTVAGTLDVTCVSGCVGGSGVSQGTATTAAPTYTTGTNNALSLTTAGALRVTDLTPMYTAVDSANPAYTNGVPAPLSQTPTGALRTIITSNLPAGANAIGTVGVTALPSIPAGANTIGGVNVVSALPAGANAIGSVTVTALPSIPTGANTIGGVNVVAALPAGANAIGTVGVTSLPILPAGSNTIGGVNVIAALPTGANAIGYLAPGSAYSNTNITATTAIVIKGSAGVLYSFYGSTSAGTTISLWDNATACSGTQIFGATLLASSANNVAMSFPVGIALSNGLTLCNSSVGAGALVAISYR